MHAIFAGGDEHELVGELESVGYTVHVVPDVANRPALEDAGIHDADLFVITDVGQATAIPVAKDLNDAIRVVCYTDDSLPEFVSGQEVLAVDPALLDSATVAEELAA
jgi:Trk K+ transport system NAD-binding subunit